ncbi:hypothetical protein [Planctomonas sp. JC2975]|uniref:hypothetical protein n=1 Tax=Planctomonas sp. JC2975 TaxID=2729626 RepID=UPI001F0DDBCB|nr:hypothetical protein [Planctomonas sp. JC2975]
MSRGNWNWYEKFNNVVRTFTGPAQLGAGHPEGPDVRRTDAACPLCHAPMNAHSVERPADQRTASRLVCP